MKSSFLKSAAYLLLDLVTLKKGVPRKINNMTVRFPPRWSRFFPSDYEADNFAFLQNHVKPGMNIIDIGAHIGLFTVCAAQLTGPRGKVICFEPTPETFAVLNETIRVNNAENVIALPQAVGGSDGEATFYISHIFEGCNANSLVINKDKAQEGYKVTLTTIDSVCRKYDIVPGLIKIDVEGAELDTLRGAAGTMKTARPVFIIGLHPQFIANKGDTLKQIWDLIKEHDYKVIRDGVEMNEQEFEAPDDIFDVQLLPY